MIEKTEAVVLKSKKYRDTSKLVTLYTRDHGKLTMIAKGSRSKNSKFGGALETLCHISIVFYNYPQKELQYISQTSINDYFHGIHDDINKTMTGMAIAEIINNTTHPNYKNEDLYNLIVNTLTALNNADNDYLKYLLYFQINYADLIGYSPDFFSCGSCGIKIESGYKFDSVYYNIEGGSVLCEGCQKKLIVPLKKSSPGTSLIIKKFSGIDSGKLNNINISKSLANEVFSIFHMYLKNHVTGMKDLKSLDLLFSMAID